MVVERWLKMLKRVHPSCQMDDECVSIPIYLLCLKISPSDQLWINGKTKSLIKINPSFHTSSRIIISLEIEDFVKTREELNEIENIAVEQKRRIYV